MKKKIQKLIPLMIVSCMLTFAMVVTSQSALAQEIEITEVIHIQPEHVLVQAFMQTDEYRRFNTRTNGRMDMQNIRLYKTAEKGKRAIAIPLLHDSEGKGGACIVTYDLTTQAYDVIVAIADADPSDGDGNFDLSDPSRFSGSLQLLSYEGELVYGGSFANGTLQSTYGNYINPCQAAVVTAFAGTVIGGLIGGPIGAIGGYLNGMVGVLLHCCCE